MYRKEIALADYPLPDTSMIEHRLISSIVTSPNHLSEVTRIVRTEMFSTKENRKIWETIMQMFNAHETIDIVTIFPKVDRKYFTENILGDKGGYSIMDSEQLAYALTEAYVKREAYISAIKVIQGVSEGAEASDIMTIYKDFPKKVNDVLQDDSCQCSQDIANELADDYEKGIETNLATSWIALNNMLYGGLVGGSLTILAARPSVGKTTLALQMAQTFSQNGKDTLICSLEMTKKELIKRLLVSTGYVNSYNLAQRKFEWQDYNNAVLRATNAHLFINDKARSIDELCTRITLQVQSGKCKAAFIDYLGLIPQNNKMISLAQHLGECTAKLKGVAKKCNIPIVLLCQLNRDSAKEGRSPQVFDLRDSGAIEQDADLILMLERPKDIDGNTREDRIDLWVRKNRNGKCTFDEPIHLKGDENYYNFYELTSDYDD